jgi:hypothetical protein
MFLPFFHFLPILRNQWYFLNFCLQTRVPN